jgi:hypothetical protein
VTGLEIVRADEIVIAFSPIVCAFRWS